MKKAGKVSVYLFGFLALAVVLAAFQPLSDPAGLTNPPDEYFRYLVPQYICAHGTIPTGLEPELRIPSYGFSYALYNAFPYIVMGLAMQVTSLFTSDTAALLFTARMVNVISGLLMAYVVWLTALRLFPRERDRWVFCLAVTYQPMNIFVHSYVNTDSFCMLSVALIIYGMTILMQDGPGLRSTLVLAAGVILCALSYYSAYGAILAAAVFYLACLFRPDSSRPGRSRFDWAGFRKYGLMTVLLILLGTAWWFIRSAIVLNGDFLGLRTRGELTAAYGMHEVQAAGTYAGRGISFGGMLGDMLRSRLPAKLAGTLIAAYGSLVVRPPVWFYAVYMLIWLVGIAGCFIGIFRRSRLEDGASSPFLSRMFRICMAVCIMMPLVLYLLYCYRTDYQEQGRYLLPALIPAMIWISRGICRFPRVVPAACMVLLVFLAAWQVFAVALPLWI